MSLQENGARNVAVSYSPSAGSPFTLSADWTKVATTTQATRGLVITPVVGATAYDIEVTSVPAGANAPEAAPAVRGTPVGFGETFPAGPPVGDIYARSLSGQVAVVLKGA